jgi:glycosyltransferase involved in cell wall biosynthesis
MPPRVTVIIATYNRAEVLMCAIASVLRQTFRDFELLVVGDGCSDDSQAAVEQLSDDRVRWLALPANSGHQSAPNNEGLRHAAGELVAYLGHDDLWLPHHLESMVATLDRTGDDVAYSLCLLVAPNGTTWPSIPQPEDGSFSPPTCMMHRRAATEELGAWREYRTLDEKREGTPDVELWRRFQRAGKRFTFVPRMTGIKFPASWRRNVYQKHSSEEQRSWLARIEREPALESTLLVSFLATAQVPAALPYRELLRYFARQTGSRLRRRLALPWSHNMRRFSTIDEIRRFKGL